MCKPPLLGLHQKIIFGPHRETDLCPYRYIHEHQTRKTSMDKDRIKGSAQQAKGKMKEVAGKISGDAKLESEGKADKASGKVRNAIGGLKDTLRGK
jgi:uncharacterized protein YjbJ (UPF0337 family)